MDELTVHRALYRPGRLLDIGAHDGLLTLPLSTLPGAMVEAFEPLPAAHARLATATAGRANIRLHACALAERDGTAELEMPSVGGVAQEQWASLVKDYAAIQAWDPRLERIDRFEVELKRLDGFAWPDITGIKLDVEGAEEEVIRGGAATIRACLPVMTVEIEERHRVGSTRAVPALLAALGLAGFFWLDGWHEVSAFNAAHMQVASPSPANFAASDPYVFIFHFVPPALVPALLALRPTG